MRAELRWGLVAWVAFAVAGAAAAQHLAGVPAVRVAFLAVPAGFLLVLVATALRHYFGRPAAPPEQPG